MKNSTLLKLASFLMLLGGGIGLVSGFIVLSGLDKLVATGVDSDQAVLLAGSSLAGSAVLVLGGIVGAIFAEKPEKATVCIVFGFFAALALVGDTMVMVMSGIEFSVFEQVMKFIFPVIYLLAAFRNKEFYDKHRP